jgi:hypothetical protein
MERIEAAKREAMAKLRARKAAKKKAATEPSDQPSPAASREVAE